MKLDEKPEGKTKLLEARQWQELTLFQSEDFLEVRTL